MRLSMMHSVTVVFVYVLHIYEFLISFCCDLEASCTFPARAQPLEVPVASVARPSRPGGPQGWLPGWPASALSLLALV